jgi:hypothetical protein
MSASTRSTLAPQKRWVTSIGSLSEATATVIDPSWRFSKLYPGALACTCHDWPLTPNTRLRQAMWFKN